MTILAVDRGHANELDIAWPTWAKYKPEILKNPLTVVADARLDSGFNPKEAAERFAYVFREMQAPVQMVHWLWPGDKDNCPLPADMTQRERMLSSLVLCTGLLHNPFKYWLKIDTDTIATRPGPWMDKDWFRGDPAIVASPWGYTKPADSIEILDAWGNGRPGLMERDPLGYSAPDGANKVCHPRTISWLSWIRTDFAETCVRFLGDDMRLPVPSQDTYHHYCAERLGELVTRPRLKNYGWDHGRQALRAAKEKATVQA